MSKTTTIQDGLVTFRIDETVLQQIEKALGDMAGESRKVLKNAVNATAKKARTDLVNKAREEFTAKKTAISKKAEIERASVSKPSAIVKFSGETLELRQFKTTAPKSGVKAKVAASGTLKLVQSQKGSRAKAFLATFQSDHTAIVQRQDGQRYKTAKGRAARQDKYGKGADMTFIKKLVSISAPKMIGDEKKVFGVLRPTIYKDLMANIQKEIDKVVNAT